MTKEKPILIGISGKMGSGKDTAANYLRDFALTDGLTCVILAMADPLKAALAAFLGVDVKLFEDQAWKNTPLGGVWGSWTPRWLLTTVGTTLFREQLDMDVHIHAIQSRIESLAESGVDIIIVSDIRMLNEANMILKSESGHLIRVDRNREDRLEYLHSKGVDPTALTFKTETELDNFSKFTEILHHETLVELRNQLEAVYDRL